MISVHALFMLQFLLDVILVVLLLALYKKLRMIDPSNLKRLIEALEHGQVLADKIEKNLKEKREITERLEQLVEGSPAQGAHRVSSIPAHSGKREQVLKLYTQGKDSSEISKQTGIPMGEVELILSLQKSQKPAA